MQGKNRIWLLPDDYVERFAGIVSKLVSDASGNRVCRSHRVFRFFIKTYRNSASPKASWVPRDLVSNRRVKNVFWMFTGYLWVSGWLRRCYALGNVKFSFDIPNRLIAYLLYNNTYKNYIHDLFIKNFHFP